MWPASSVLTVLQYLVNQSQLLLLYITVCKNQKIHNVTFTYVVNCISDFPDTAGRCCQEVNL